MTFLLVKYDDVTGKYRPVNETTDIFGFNGIRLNGDLFDNTNIALKSEVSAVAADLVLLENDYLAHVNQQNVDLADIRNQLSALYSLCSSLGAEINALMNDVPKTEDIIATTGQLVFSSSFSWAESNAVLDIMVFKNGVHQTQDITGVGLHDYIKLNDHQIQFSVSALDQDRITIEQCKTLLNVTPKTYFRYDLTSLNGVSVIVPDPYRYALGTEKLSVWRNGVYLLKSNILGGAIDRYEETTSKFVTLGAVLDSSEIITLQNRTEGITYRYNQSGLTGISVTVPTYITPSNGRLRVYRNGLLMNSSGAGDLIDQYVEASSTSITLALAATSNEVFTVEFMSTVPQISETQTNFTGTLITLVNSYVTGTDKLLVFKNGKLMYKSYLVLGSPEDRYTETTVNSLTLEVAAELTDWFTIIYN